MGPLVKDIGVTISEQHDIISIMLIVLEQQRKKYDCPTCESNVVTVALPPQPIPKCIANPGL